MLVFFELAFKQMLLFFRSIFDAARMSDVSESGERWYLQQLFICTETFIRYAQKKKQKNFSIGRVLLVNCTKTYHLLLLVNKIYHLIGQLALSCLMPECLMFISLGVRWHLLDRKCYWVYKKETAVEITIWIAYFNMPNG